MKILANRKNSPSSEPPNPKPADAPAFTEIKNMSV